MLILASVFLLTGSSICLLAAIGVLRLPDVFMRMHAATKAGVAGCGMVLLGVAMADVTFATSIKALVAILFMVLTTPIAAHILGRTAYISGVPFWHGTIKDELEGVLPRRKFISQAPACKPNNSPFDSRSNQRESDETL